MIHEGGPTYIFVAERWELALARSHEALGLLREVYPTYFYHVTETGGRAVDSAMEHLKDAIVDLHRAGRHVLGSEQYERFVEEKSERDIIERGELDGS